MAAGAVAHDLGGAARRSGTVGGEISFSSSATGLLCADTRRQASPPGHECATVGILSSAAARQSFEVWALRFMAVRSKAAGGVTHFPPPACSTVWARCYSHGGVLKNPARLNSSAVAPAIRERVPPAPLARAASRKLTAARPRSAAFFNLKDWRRKWTHPKCKKSFRHG